MVILADPVAHAAHQEVRHHICLDLCYSYFAVFFTFEIICRRLLFAIRIFILLRIVV